jgi:hypothetical protein
MGADVPEGLPPLPSVLLRYPVSAAPAGFHSGSRIEVAGRSISSTRICRDFSKLAKRPELAGVNSPFSASVPQIYADVDRDKVLKQGRGC